MWSQASYDTTTVCMQEHVLQGGWTQTPSFNLKNLQASLCHGCQLAAYEAAVPWAALQEVVVTAAHIAGLSQHNRLLLRPTAA